MPSRESEIARSGPGQGANPHLFNVLSGWGMDLLSETPMENLHEGRRLIRGARNTFQGSFRVDRLIGLSSALPVGTIQR
jgi:hypothetical protein